VPIDSGNQRLSTAPRCDSGTKLLVDISLVKAQELRRFVLGRRSHSRRTSSTRLHVECAGHGTDRMKYRIIWPVLLTTRYRRADSPLVLRREDRLDIECAAAGKGELRLAVRKMSVQTPSALCFAVEPSGKHGRDRVPELRRPTTIYSRLIKPAAGMIGLPSESAPCPSAIASSGGVSISSVRHPGYRVRKS